MAKEAMQKEVTPDLQMREFWKNPERFADLFNGTVFGGVEVLKADALEEVDSNVSGVLEGKGGRSSIGRVRDLVRKSSHGTQFVIVGIENQMAIHYAMPLRTMLYDGLGYLHETQEVARKRKESKPKMTTDEFLSKFGKEDCLMPIVTIVVYYGEKVWDGPRSLLDMMGELPVELKKVVSDYKMNLVEVLREDASKFQDREIRQVFEYSQAFMMADRTRVEELKEQQLVTKDVAYMIGTITKATTLVKMLIKEEQEEVDMCKFLEDIMEEGRVAGRRDGMEMKEKETLGILMNKLNLTLNEAMDMLNITGGDREKYRELIS